MTTTLVAIVASLTLLIAVLIPVRRSRKNARVRRRRQARIQMLAEGIAEDHAEGEDASAQIATLREWAPLMSQEDWQLFESHYREHYDDLTTRLHTGNAEMERLEQTFRRNQETSRARLEMNPQHRPPKKSAEEYDRGDPEPVGDSELAEFQALLDKHGTSSEGESQRSELADFNLG